MTNTMGSGTIGLLHHPFCGLVALFVMSAVEHRETDGFVDPQVLDQDLVTSSSQTLFYVL
jgi:hypothetical protein